MRKVALVTGASSGIGRSVAKHLSKQGMIVYDLSRTDKPAYGIIHVKCDVTEERSVINAVNAILSEQGHIDILVCCAGMGISGAVEFTDPEDSRRQIDVNLFGTDRMVRAVLPTMRKERSGRIVIISSVAGVTPIPFQTWYSVSKAALCSYALALQNEVRPYGITVSSVLPGDIKTGFTAARKKSSVGDQDYDGRIERSVARMEKDEQNGLSPEFAARIVVKAATKPRPKAQYATGLSYSAICVLIRLLPQRLSQWILYQMYAK